MARKQKAAITVQGLVAARPFVGTWKGRPGRSLTYHAPSDCRPLARRINVQLWDDGIGSYAAVIEGDGRKPDFKRIAEVVLPDHVSTEQLVTVVSGLAAQHLAVRGHSEPDPIRTVAGMLVRAGFREDDFMGSTAWLRETGDGHVHFIRAEPEPRAVDAHDGARFVIGVPVALDDPEMPVEVGIANDDHPGFTSTVAPSLEEAIAVADANSLPLPREGEESALDYGTLGAGRASLG